MARKSNYDPWKASKIKVLNERQREIGKQFGKDSQFYQDYHNALVLAVGPENINASGNIKRGPVTYALLDNETISALLRHQTAGQIRKAAQREARYQSEISGDHYTADEIIKARTEMDKLYTEDEDMFYEAAKFYWESVGGKKHPRPTYAQLSEIHKSGIIQRVEGKIKIIGVRKEVNPITGEVVTSNIEDKLRKRIKAQDERRQSNMLASYFPEA